MTRGGGMAIEGRGTHRGLKVLIMSYFLYGTVIFLKKNLTYTHGVLAFKDLFLDKIFSH